jgi:hypothetical protein
MVREPPAARLWERQNSAHNGGHTGERIAGVGPDSAIELVHASVAVEDIIAHVLEDRVIAAVVGAGPQVRSRIRRPAGPT